MSYSGAEISRVILDLPMADRAALIDRLYESIDTDLKTARANGVLTNWGEESERRIDAVERGELKTIDGAAAMAEFRRSLQK
jgi:hypothetical protein